MNVKIGENIKRLRKEKGITQEGLSEICNVSCVAVSKWENNETYPDMTLLMPLAHYFGVSIDELLGYNNEKIEQEINDLLDEYFKLYYTNTTLASSLIKEGYKKYPNDYNIIYHYMYNIAGGKADNDNDVLIENKEILLKLSDRLSTCEIEKYRLDAWNIKAKVLYAIGNEAAALEIYDTKFIDWYQTKDQKKEQLYTKDKEEFLEQLDQNINSLLSFVGNKIGKKVIYSKNTHQEKMVVARNLYNMYSNIKDNDDFIMLKILFENIFKELTHRAKMINMDEQYINELAKYENEFIK